MSYGQFGKALDDRERQLLFDKVLVCGANRGPHAYIPISWIQHENSKHVAHLLCTNCFCRVSTQTLFRHFPEFKLPE